MTEPSSPPAFEDESRCRIHARDEIISILRELRDAGTLSTAYFATDDFIVTMVLDVHPQTNLVIIDCGADEAANRRLLRAASVHVDTQLEEIRIRFSCDRARAMHFEGKPAIGLPLPAWVVRLQRRENYRVRIPLSEQVHCYVRLDRRSDTVNAQIRVLDISCGGVALMDVPGNLPVEAGKTYSDCRIELANTASIITDIEVRHMREIQSRAGHVALRCGCRFVNLTASKVAQIQRFIYLQERRRLVEE